MSVIRWHQAESENGCQVATPFWALKTSPQCCLVPGGWLLLVSQTHMEPTEVQGQHGQVALKAAGSWS